MLTYTETKTVTQPRLVISYDQDAESPREWDPIGYFLTKESKYKSPDGNNNSLYNIMVNAQYEANNSKEHTDIIKKQAQEEGIHIIDIYPVYRYEHGNIVYKRGEAQGFDYSNCGFYIVTTDTIEGTTQTTESIAKAIDQELDIYSKWVNGEVYQFTLYDTVGNIIDDCGGFYSLEEIQERLISDYSDEWKDESMGEYFINE